MSEETRTRLAMARTAAAELLDELEGSSAPVAQSLMRAKRLARLLRDADAQRWLDLELKGYPNGFSFEVLGTCQRYASEGGRLTDDGKYYLKSLPGIEADYIAQESSLNSPAAASPTGIAGNFVEANATILLRTKEREAENLKRASYAHSRSLCASLRAAIHSYASDCIIALELGDTAEDIFEGARREVDTFIRAYVPKAAEQLLAISERIREGTSEGYSGALTSCRRLIAATADAVFPAQDAAYIDGSGKKRQVGPDEYKNRLLAFIEKRVASTGTRQLLEADLAHLAARLDAVYEKVCKGVHADVTAGEARLAVIHAYLFVAEVARLHAAT